MSKVSDANLQDILTHIGNNRFLPQIVQHFDKSMIFSTDEMIVGQWIDGKPIYQKTINDLNLTGSWSGQYNYALADQNPLIDNVDNIISAFGIINYQNTVNTTPVSITKNFTTNKWSYYRYVSGAINTLTIQYTKTTD